MFCWKTLHGSGCRLSLHMLRKSRSSCLAVLVMFTAPAGGDTPLGVSSGSVSEFVIERSWLVIIGVVVPAPARMLAWGVKGDSVSKSDGGKNLSNSSRSSLVFHMFP